MENFDQISNLAKLEKSFILKFGDKFKSPKIYDNNQNLDPQYSSFDSSNGHIRRLFLGKNMSGIECPLEIQNLSELNSLYMFGLDSWDFQQLGEYVKKLNRLVSLTIQQCNITEFPEWICKFPQLRELFLTHNNLQSIPSSIKELKMLKDVFLDHNKFMEIPHSLSDLQTLEILNMDYNRIVEIPAWIESLKKLKQLFLCNNCISIIPPQIAQLKALKKLYLDNNSIKNFSDGIISDDLMPDLNLVNNPLEPFYQRFLSFENSPYYLRRFNQFVPQLTLKIQNNLPLDEFDKEYPLYGKYREIFGQIIEKYPTKTAEEVKEILRNQGSINNSKSFLILL